MTIHSKRYTSRGVVQFVAVLILFMVNHAAFALESVGVVTFSRGTVAALHEGYKPRVLGKSAQVYEGDNIQTSERSFAVITFKDKSKITVRPNSNFSVSLFSMPNEKAKFDLYSGGVRASTGTIAQKAPENFQIETPDTTVNAQQADFSVRVCKEGCQQQEDKLKKTAKVTAEEVIARIVKVRGLVVATNEKILSQDERILTVGAPLYSADLLNSKEDSFAVVVFKDKGRITLDSDTSFAIKEYSFDAKKEDNKSLFDLVVGSIRVLTGRIGKKKKAQYKINTPVATIGIRGTGFDLAVNKQGGLHSRVWQGTITSRNDAGETELSVPNSSFTGSVGSAPKELGNLSAKQLAALSRGKQGDDAPEEDNEPPPRPDDVDVPGEKNLFESQDSEGAQEGTYVDVHKGHVKVEDESGDVDLGKRESSYSKNGKSLRTEQPPEIMKQDFTPLPSKEFKESSAEVEEHSLLGDKLRLKNSKEENDYQCLVR